MFGVGFGSPDGVSAARIVASLQRNDLARAILVADDCLPIDRVGSDRGSAPVLRLECVCSRLFVRGHSLGTHEKCWASRRAGLDVFGLCRGDLDGERVSRLRTRYLLVHVEDDDT